MLKVFILFKLPFISFIFTLFALPLFGAKTESKHCFTRFFKRWAKKQQKPISQAPLPLTQPIEPISQPTEQTQATPESKLAEPEKITSLALSVISATQPVLTEQSKQKTETQVTSILENFHQIPSLDQKDEWRCGYFAVFNLIQLMKAVQKNRKLKTLDFSSNKYERRFARWLKKMRTLWENHPTLPEKFLTQEWLGKDDVEALLSLNFNTGIETLRDIVVLEEKNLPSLFKDNLIRDAFLRFRKEKKPLYCIFVSEDHWTTHLLMPDQSMYGLDSFSDNHNNLKSEPFIQSLFNFCFTDLPIFETLQEKRAITKATKKLEQEAIEVE